jgi:hypothetical protein
MDVKQMMAKHARACARLAQQGPLIVEDVLGSDDFCLMRVGANMFVCFDCELVVVTDTTRPPIKHLHPIELTDDQLPKVHAVLQSSGKWDCVHMLDGTMDDPLAVVVLPNCCDAWPRSPRSVTAGLRTPVKVDLPDVRCDPNLTLHGLSR